MNPAPGAIVYHANDTNMWGPGIVLWCGPDEYSGTVKARVQWGTGRITSEPPGRLVTAANYGLLAPAGTTVPQPDTATAVQVTHNMHSTALWTVKVTTTELRIMVPAECGHTATICTGCADIWTRKYAHITPLN